MCPGTCRTSKARSPRSTTSPSSRSLVGSVVGVRQPATSKSSPGSAVITQLGGLVAVPADLVLETRPEVLSQQREPVGLADPVRIGRMTPALVEGVQPADVVEVIVRRDRHDRSIADERRELRAEVADPVPRIHDEVAARVPARATRSIRRTGRDALPRAARCPSVIRSARGTTVRRRADRSQAIGEEDRRRRRGAGNGPTPSRRCTSRRSGSPRCHPPRSPASDSPRRTDRCPR